MVCVLIMAAASARVYCQRRIHVGNCGITAGQTNKILSFHIVICIIIFWDAKLRKKSFLCYIFRKFFFKEIILLILYHFSLQYNSFCVLHR